MSIAIRVIQPSSFLSAAAINSFQSEIRSAVESNVAIVLIDLKFIPSMSSASFLTVIKALKLVWTSGRQLFLCSLSDQIRILFELTGLDRAIKTFADMNEFNRHIQMQRGAMEVPRQLRSDVDVIQVDRFKLAS